MTLTLKVNRLMTNFGLFEITDLELNRIETGIKSVS